MNDATNSQIHPNYQMKIIKTYKNRSMMKTNSFSYALMRNLQTTCVQTNSTRECKRHKKINIEIVIILQEYVR